MENLLVKWAPGLNELKEFELLSAVIVKRKTDSYHMHAPQTNSPDLNLTTLAVFYLIFFRAQRCARKET